MSQKTTVQDILKSKGHIIISIAPDDTVYNTIKLMAEKKIGCLLVMHGDKLEGIISERDYAWKCILEGKNSKSAKVEDLMSRELFCISPETPVIEALAIMTEKHVRHLPVLKDNRCTGLVSMGDLVFKIISDQEQEISHLINYISDAYV